MSLSVAVKLAIVTLLVDATTAQHARGIGTVIAGILEELPFVAPDGALVVMGPDAPEVSGLRNRRVRLAGTRPGRLAYQRLLLPIDVELIRSDEPVDQVLLLDSYVPIVRLRRRVRYGALIHDVLPLTHPHFWPLAKRIVKRTAFSTIRHAKPTLFTSTEHNAAQIRELLGTPARVVHFGCGQVDDARADEARTAPLPHRGAYLLHVGALEPRKNVLALVRIFEEAISSLASDLRLVLLGDGAEPYVRQVRAAVAASGHSERIELRSEADRTSALELLAHASALVLPSLAEGFGLPILEALALGTPVVASDLPAIRSWAGDSILYASPNRPCDWVAPIESALKSGEERRRAGQTFSAQYRWRFCANDLLDF